MGSDMAYPHLLAAQGWVSLDTYWPRPCPARPLKYSWNGSLAGTIMTCGGWDTPAGYWSHGGPGSATPGVPRTLDHMLNWGVEQGYAMAFAVRAAGEKAKGRRVLLAEKVLLIAEGAVFGWLYNTTRVRFDSVHFQGGAKVFMPRFDAMVEASRAGEPPQWWNATPATDVTDPRNTRGLSVPKEEHGAHHRKAAGSHHRRKPAAGDAT